MGSQDLTKAARHARAHVPVGKDWVLVRTEGAGPFISRIVHRLPDGSLHIWTSRAHRKGGGIRCSIAATAWAPAELGWWIAILFMTGSACFALGSLAGLAPDLLEAAFQHAAVVNTVFFIGSIFFTSAAYLQVLEAANADRRAAQARGEAPPHPFRWFGWQPGEIGWLSASVQFAGTLLFNMNTTDAMLPGLNWLNQDLLIWTPDAVGSICFLVASWLAVLECCHGMACWKIQGLDWWIVMINLLGSIGFGISARFAITLPRATDVLNLFAVNLWTFIGALCFLIAAWLLLPEMATQKTSIE